MKVGLAAAQAKNRKAESKAEPQPQPQPRTRQLPMEKSLSVAKLPPRPPVTPPVARSIPFSDDPAMLSLLEAREDSPLFRVKLSVAEQDIEDLSAGLKRVVKAFHAIAANSAAYGQSISALCTEMQLLSASHKKYVEHQATPELAAPTPANATAVAEDSSYLNFSETMLSFARQLQDIERLRSGVLDPIQQLIADPIDSFVNVEIPKVKEASKKYHASCKQYDTTATKLSAQRRNMPRQEEAQAEMDLARMQHKKITMDYAAQINKMTARRRVELSERFTELMTLHVVYFFQAAEQVREFEPKLKILAQNIQCEKKRITEDEQRVERTISELVLVPDDVASAELGETAASLQKEKGKSGVAAAAKSVDKSRTMEYQGWLFKKSSNVSLREWKRGYFVVKDGVLNYYKAYKEIRTTPNETLELLLCTVRPCSESNRNHSFEIVSPYRTFVVQAENGDAMKMWITAITNNIEKALAAQMKNGSNSGSSNVSASAGTTLGSRLATASGGRASISPATAYLDNKNTSQEAEDPDKAQREKNLRTLYARDPANAVCADCGALKPTWVSLNMGVLICIECSGIHRSLGTHLSKVRSVLLDKIDPESFYLLYTIGNKKANEILEGIVQDPTSKPTPSASRADRERWIRTKYGDKLFAKPFVASASSSTTIEAELIRALKAKDIDCTYQLLVQGAVANPTSTTLTLDQLPLHIASSNADLLSMELLLQNSANPNKQDAEQQWAPLHVVASKNLSHQALLLFKRGAKLDLKDSEDKSPLDVAMDLQHADCVTLLRLAQYAHAERHDITSDDKSFAEALSQFSFDFNSVVDGPGSPSPSTQQPPPSPR